MVGDRADADGEVPALAAEAVSVRFGDHRALDGVDVEVADGHIAALLGPSGCGKTTLLRVVAGLQRPDAGRVRLGGVDVTDVAPHRRGVGLMFQQYALFPHRDVAANVGFGLAVRKEPKARIRARVAEVLELVGLAGYERRSVGQLSGGEQQRVALARALAPAPRVLLLDEPLGSLDRTLRDRLVVDLRHLFRELAVTVVTVTHDQDEALAIADRLVVMDHGTVAQAGTPAEVWDRPASPAVARLLGMANVVAVDVRDGAVHAPWGVVGPAIGLAPGAGQVVVRPAAVELVAAASDARGPGPVGVVVGRSFRGDRVLVEVDIAGHRLEASVAPADAPAEGTEVRVSVAAGGLVPVAGDPAPTPDRGPGSTAHGAD